MNKTYLSLAIFPAIIATACGGAQDNPTPSTSSEEKMEIRISPKLSDTRATDYGFETGDAIGLYVVNYNGSNPGTLAATGNHVDNMRFRYNSTWTPDTPVTWSDKETHADFYVYYPYSEVTDVTAHSFSVQPDQSMSSRYKASDFMLGKASDVAPTASAVEIPVSHAFSRAVVTLEAGNGFTAASLAAANVSVKLNGLKCGASVNLASGAVTATGNPMDITPLHDNEGYRALVVPQTVDEGNLITVNVDGRDFNLRKGFTFEAGKSHRFTVTLSKTSTGVNVNINPWNEDDTDNGGTAE